MSKLFRLRIVSVLFTLLLLCCQNKIGNSNEVDKKAESEGVQDKNAKTSTRTDKSAFPNPFIPKDTFTTIVSDSMVDLLELSKNSINMLKSIKFTNGKNNKFKDVGLFEKIDNSDSFYYIQNEKENYELCYYHLISQIYETQNNIRIGMSIESLRKIIPFPSKYVKNCVVTAYWGYIGIHYNFIFKDGRLLQIVYNGLYKING